MYQAHTDLAIEAREMYFENAMMKELEGVDVETENPYKGITVTRVNIISESGEKSLQKPKGKYITIEMPLDFQKRQEIYEDLCKTCASELKSLIKMKKDDVALVVGLGNWNITADAIGPKVVKSLMVTRHLVEYVPEELDERIRPVCAIAPGVLGLTGIETGEIVMGLVEKVKPTLVIAIDALCSRNMERIHSTIQLSNTGITPGSGIGNKRMAIDRETLGVPVISIGVPTVVDAATIAGDTIDLILRDLKANARSNEPLYKMLSIIQEEDKYSLIKQALKPSVGEFVVTPKEVDTVVEDISQVIANGINLAIHDGLELSEVEQYI